MRAASRTNQIVFGSSPPANALSIIMEAGSMEMAVRGTCSLGAFRLRRWFLGDRLLRFMYSVLVLVCPRSRVYNFCAKFRYGDSVISAGRKNP